MNKSHHYENCPPIPTVSLDKAKVNGQEPTVEDFMEMMDRELMRTNVGKSFEKASALPKYDSSMKVID